MYDYIRIASIVNNVKVGDTGFNARDILSKIKEAAENNADIIFTPELALTGYTCGDLFFQTELINGALDGLLKILDETKDLDASIVIGVPLVIDGQLYNCAAVCEKGKILGIVPKTFIPCYNEFSEKRRFNSSADLKLDFISSKALKTTEEYSIPVGRDLIFDMAGKATFGVEICEDIFAPVSPSDFLTINGAEIILNLSASNELVTKDEARLEHIKRKSASQICVYAYASAGAGESTSDFVFSGKSVVCENGTVLNENKNYIASDYIMLTDADLGKVKSDRMKIKTFKETSLLYGNFQKSRKKYIEKEGFKSKGEYGEVSKLPFVPDKADARKKRCMNIFALQAAGLKKRIEVTNGRPVIGISGGLDSTLALLVCVEAIKQLGKPESEITAVTMPGFGTTDRTYENALKLMKALGITIREISIKDACLKHFSDIGQDPKNHDAAYENAQARERTQILMDIANQINGFVVGTGDLSEIALGWCTYNGDQMSMYAVNADIPKSLIRWIIESAMENNAFKNCSDVLEDILKTPISPELLPPDADGKIAQKTEELVGPYALHDFFIYYMVRYGFSPEKIYTLAKKAFANDFDDETILKWLKAFYRRFFSQQFKRTASPDGIKVGSVGLSPRSEWQMPSDITSKLWLEAIEKM